MVKIAKEIEKADNGTFKVSQSAFKDFYKPEVLFCPWAWKAKYIDGIHPDEDISEAVRDGIVFETKCIGAGAGGKVLEMDKKEGKSLKPIGGKKSDMLEYLEEHAAEVRELGLFYDEKTSNKDLEVILRALPEDRAPGEPYQAEIDIDKNVDLFRALKGLYNCEELDTQLYMEDDDKKGTADWRVRLDWNGDRPIALIDLKYACTKYENEFMNGWSQPSGSAFNRIRRIAGHPYRDTGYLSGFLDAGTLTERVAYMETLTRYESGCIQAVHYCILHYKQYRVWPRWFFWIFGKSGWIRIKQVELLDLAAVEAHENALNIFWSDLEYYEKYGYDYNPTYAGCMGCDFRNSCEKFKKFPEVEVTSFGYGTNN